MQEPDTEVQKIIFKKLWKMKQRTKSPLSFLCNFNKENFQQDAQKQNQIWEDFCKICVLTNQKKYDRIDGALAFQTRRGALVNMHFAQIFCKKPEFFCAFCTPEIVKKTTIRHYAQ